MVFLGVIWKGDTLIDGVPDTLTMLRDKVSSRGFVFDFSSLANMETTIVHSANMAPQDMHRVLIR